MRLTTKESRCPSVTRRLSLMIKFLGLNVEGISLSVTDRHAAPYCVRAAICLPSIRKCGGWELFAKSFLHEYSHARDYLEDNDDLWDEKERRARLMERLYPTSLFWAESRHA